MGLALGIQSKFDWGDVGLAAVTAGVTKGIGATGLFKALDIGGNTFGEQFLQGAISSVASQGVAVATGLQSKFDWAGVAAAGIGNGVIGYAGRHLQGTFDLGSSNANADAVDAVSGAADLIANAATRSLVDGSDFGDNIMAALPDTVAQTIGNAVSCGIQESDLAAQYETAGVSHGQAIAAANSIVTGDPTDYNNWQKDHPQQPWEWTSAGTTGVTVHNTPVSLPKSRPRQLRHRIADAIRLFPRIAVVQSARNEF